MLTLIAWSRPVFVHLNPYACTAIIKTVITVNMNVIVFFCIAFSLPLEPLPGKSGADQGKI